MKRVKNCEECAHFEPDLSDPAQSEAMPFFISLPSYAQCAAVEPPVSTLDMRDAGAACGPDGKLFTKP